MTTAALLVYLLVGSAAGFSLPSRRSPSSSPRTTRTRLFLRNIDRPELIIFGCERAFAEDDDEENEGAAQTPAPHPGVVALSQDVGLLMYTYRGVFTAHQLLSILHAQVV